MSATERPTPRPTTFPGPIVSGLKLPPPQPPRFSLSFKIFFAAALLILITVGGAIAISATRARAIADSKIDEDLKKSGGAWESFQRNRYEELHRALAVVVNNAGIISVMTQLDPATARDTLKAEQASSARANFLIAIDQAGTAFARTDKRRFALGVLSAAFGGGMSSRLFQEVREKRGLCYSVFSFASAYEDAGQFGVYAATSPDDTPELVDVTADVMLSTAKSVTEIEVARAKAQLKASLVMSLESATGRADQIARQFLAFGEVPAMETLVAKIEAVTADHVAGLAASLFKGKSPALSAVGQLSTLTPYAKIKAQFT